MMYYLKIISRELRCRGTKSLKSWATTRGCETQAFMAAPKTTALGVRTLRGHGGLSSHGWNGQIKQKGQKINMKCRSGFKIKFDLLQNSKGK